jgi:Zn-dependent peptidase ImmA (M78 family)
MTYLYMTSFQRAETLSKEILDRFQERYGITPLPVPVIAIAEQMLELKCLTEKPSCRESHVAGQLLSDFMTIVVNDNCSPHQHDFAIAHEIGHWLLHNTTGNSRPTQKPRRMSKQQRKALQRRSNQSEREANLFAAALLMPQRALLEYANSFAIIDHSAVKALAQAFNVVSLTSLIYRLSDLNDYMEWSGPPIDWASLQLNEYLANDHRGLSRRNSRFLTRRKAFEVLQALNSNYLEVFRVTI